MKKTISTLLIILIIIGLLSLVIVGSRNKKTSSLPPQNNEDEFQISNSSPGNPIILFYGNTCPHCKDVEEWMEKNKIEEKIKIVKKEVYDNQENSQELAKVAEGCGLPTYSIGVPFLYTSEGKCLVGTPDIISYLSDKAGLSGDTKATN